MSKDDVLRQQIMADMQADGWRQCAKGQHTSQFCGQLEAEKANAYAKLAAEREVSDKLVALLKSAFDINNNLGSQWLLDASFAIAEVEAIRKGEKA